MNSCSVLTQDRQQQLASCVPDAHVLVHHSFSLVQESLHMLLECRADIGSHLHKYAGADEAMSSRCYCYCQAELVSKAQHGTGFSCCSTYSHMRQVLTGAKYTTETARTDVLKAEMPQKSQPAPTFVSTMESSSLDSDCLRRRPSIVKVPCSVSAMYSCCWCSDSPCCGD